MNSPRENPFRHMGEWYWIDEFDQTHGPFKTQGLALTNLLRYLQPTQIWQPITNSLLVEILFFIVAIGVFSFIWWAFFT